LEEAKAQRRVRARHRQVNWPFLQTLPKKIYSRCFGLN
jgi:hypothetical protein